MINELLDIFNLIKFRFDRNENYCFILSFNLNLKICNMHYFDDHNKINGETDFNFKTNYFDWYQIEDFLDKISEKLNYYCRWSIKHFIFNDEIFSISIFAKEVKKYEIN